MGKVARIAPQIKSRALGTRATAIPPISRPTPGDISFTDQSVGRRLGCIELAGNSSECHCEAGLPAINQVAARAILELLYPKADGAGIHCFKVLTIAGKTIIESAVGAATRVAPGEAPILRETRG